MNSTKNPAHAHIATIRYLTILNIVVVLLLGGSMYVVNSLVSGIAVSVPPDLRTGALLTPDKKFPEEVFAFTWTNFSTVQSWSKNGEKDYEKKINSLDPFFTLAFKESLMTDFESKKRRGELDKVRRRLSLPDGYIFETKAIKVVDDNTWVVTFPAEIVEFTGDSLTKDIEVLYSLIVRRARTDVKSNAWQIAIDGYYAEPIRTKDRLSKTVVKQDRDLLIDRIYSAQGVK